MINFGKSGGSGSDGGGSGWKIGASTSLAVTYNQILNCPVISHVRNGNDHHICNYHLKNIYILPLYLKPKNIMFALSSTAVVFIQFLLKTT